MDSMGGDVRVESGEKIDREPRMDIMADLSNEKFSLHLSQCSVELHWLIIVPLKALAVVFIVSPSLIQRDALCGYSCLSC